MLNNYELNFYMDLLRVCSMSAIMPELAMFALTTISGKDGENVPDRIWSEYQKVKMEVLANNVKAEISAM